MTAMLVVLAVAAAIVAAGPSERELWRLQRWLDDKGETMQTACEDCTQGVMDADNDHLKDGCGCSCHLLQANTALLVENAELKRRVQQLEEGPWG